MKNGFRILLALTVVFLVSSFGNAFATNIDVSGYTNITRYDGVGSGGQNMGHEDNEVEPGMDPKQIWDLEAFYSNNAAKTLTMVGGFNFADGVDGYTSSPRDFTSGDIFISVGNEPTYGDLITDPEVDGNQVYDNTYGYDYALHLDFENNQYQIYSLTATSSLISSWYGVNSGSNPWKADLTDDDTVLEGVGTMVQGFATNSGLSAYWNGIGTHYALELNLEPLLTLLGVDATKDLYFHFTMGCGNDSMMGATAYGGDNPVPEPATLMLLGIGMLGVAGFSRKKFQS